MNKRGQVTVFVILGIVVVALIVLLLAFRKEIIPTSATTENLNGIMDDIRDHISDCIKESAEGPLERIALQGGYLSVPAGSYRLWNDNTVSFLCYNQQNTERCMNRLLTREKMEEELSEAVKQELASCIDVQSFSSGIIKTFEVVLSQPMKLTTSIMKDQVVFNLNYPVTLKSKSSDNVVTEKEFSVPVEVPLGELYEVALDILDAETSIGRFDTLTYMLAKMSRYTLYLHKPYPDKIYQIQMRDGDYIFQFAVEGEPS
ncbi:MAG: hypothetical protein KJ939_05545 [Nanoarchaeota archaeon]|nr:hypothetical protein [Nanoarchaeota archaeon]